MRIAVIGASGLLGRHTIQAAKAAGHESVAIGRSPQALQLMAEAGFETRTGNLPDASSLTRALQGMDAVINCAGYYPTTPRPWRSEVATAIEEMRAFYDVWATLPLSKVVYLGAAIAT
jgi:dihydroflavonol-4-reductase